jgi:hypothetical protein
VLPELIGMVGTCVNADGAWINLPSLNHNILILTDLVLILLGLILQNGKR